MQKIFVSTIAALSLFGAAAAMAQTAPGSQGGVSASQTHSTPVQNSDQAGGKTNGSIATDNPTGASPGQPLMGGTIGPGAPNHTGGMKGGTTAGGVGGAS